MFVLGVAVCDVRVHSSRRQGFLKHHGGHVGPYAVNYLGDRVVACQVVREVHDDGVAPIRLEWIVRISSLGY